MRERRKLVAVSVGRLELDALNAPENGERRTENGGGAGAPQRTENSEQRTERPVGATDVISASGEAAAVSTIPTNTAGRFDVGTAVPSCAEGAEGQGNSQASKLPSLQASGGEAAKVVYRDWGVCGALGWRRRKLVGVRRGLARGVDWDVCEGEVGMLGAWCARQGLDVSKLARAGDSGLVSVEVVGFVQNRQLVLARRFSDGVVAPVRVRDAGAFRRGDVFECRGGALAGAWPRRDW